MNSISLYITIFLCFVVLSFCLIFLFLQWYHRKNTQKDIYTCIEYFIRHIHELAFYHPTKHRDFREYKHLYVRLKKERHKWYFNDKWKCYISDFLSDFEKADKLISVISAFMGEDHYFSHSEYLSCKQYADFTFLKKYIDERFLKSVNRNVPLSFLHKENYLEILYSDISDIPQRHNLIFVEEELRRNKVFFDTVMTYPLDQQQRDSIVKLEDNTLVISSAGSGKTSTMVGKIKYLVEKRQVNPDQILPLTFARKASVELTERLGYEDRGLRSHTFHGYALHIVEEVTNRRQTICRPSTLLQCFYHQANVNPEFKKAINTFLTEKESLTKDSHEYTSAREYLEDRALYGIQAPFLDMDNRVIFTRSEEEKKICTFLSMNSVLFRYEAPFHYNTTSRFRRQYTPDFTIYFQVNGQWRYVILEHFGIDENGNVPIWFGDGKGIGGYARANREYNEGIRWKRQITSDYNITLLETTSAMFRDGTIYQNLRTMLEGVGVQMAPLTEEQKFEKLVERNHRMEDAIMQLIETFIALMKSNRSSFENILETIKNETNNEAFIERSRFMLYEIFKPIYEDYCHQLNERNEVDYTDLILMATDFCKEGRFKPQFEYILIDEFQDISVARFRFLQSLRSEEPFTKLYCVGDDWQSIFRFTGSDLTLFSDFEEYFGFTEKCKIETTYRFSNPMIKISSDFIMKNNLQVPKEIRPHSQEARTDLSVYEYYENEAEGETQTQAIKRLIDQIPENETIMLLARYHADIDFIPSHNIVSRDDKNRVAQVRIAGRVVPFNTIHAAKGLEADHVIIINCSQDGNGFPSKISDDPILGYVLSKPESYPFAEERRLFYVAITRAKKHCYILYKNTCPSSFITDVGRNEATTRIKVCPMCRVGTLRKLGFGETPFGRWALYGCTNRSAGCPYTWFVNYYNDEDIDRQFQALAAH